MFQMDKSCGYLSSVWDIWNIYSEERLHVLKEGSTECIIQVISDCSSESKIIMDLPFTRAYLQETSITNVISYRISQYLAA